MIKSILLLLCLATTLSIEIPESGFAHHYMSLFKNVIEDNLSYTERLAYNIYKEG